MPLVGGHSHFSPLDPCDLGRPFLGGGGNRIFRWNTDFSAHPELDGAEIKGQDNGAFIAAGARVRHAHERPKNHDIAAGDHLGTGMDVAVDGDIACGANQLA